MKFRIAIILAVAALAMFAWGCSDDKPTGTNGPDTTGTNTTTWNSAGYWESTVNASGTSSFVHYSFARKDTVILTQSQAESDTSWNIAFKRSSIILNGGVSGPGEDAGIDLATAGHADSTNFTNFSDLTSIGSDWVSDSYNLVIDEWYSYNPQTHSLNPTQFVYIMKDAAGNYVKFQVLAMVDPGMPPDMGTISVQYIYAGTSPTFSGTPDTLTFDASSGNPVYVDFSTGATVNPADPRTSTDWDLAFTNYEVHQNATVFGPGASGTYEIWMDQTIPTDFNETLEAPTAPQAYFADDFGSVMKNWYNYNGETHTLTSKQHVYVIQTGAHYYKMQIITYYKEIGGSPVSGWYNFRWAELD
jgi:hypothetical protein